MPKLLSKAPFTGAVAMLLANPDRATGLEKHEVQEVRLLLSGIEGDCHGGFTRKSDSRMLEQFKRGTEVRNARQISILAMDELADIATIMNIPMVKPEWVGANMVTTGIPDLSMLPPSSRLQFPSGATVVIDNENFPCRYPAEIIEKHHPNPARGFAKAGMHKRGVVGWVEREGRVAAGDVIIVWIPQQRIYAHA